MTKLEKLKKLEAMLNEMDSVIAEVKDYYNEHSYTISDCTKGLLEMVEAERKNLEELMHTLDED